MSRILELVERFDAIVSGHGDAPPRPTPFSIGKINEHFGIELPASLIEFSRNSKSYGGWFASIGPDYDSHTHIIHINSYWRRRRRTRAIPGHLVAINLGFDEDLDCINKESFDTATGEYAIQYWCPDVKDGAVEHTFANYIESHIKSWESSKRRPADG